MVNKAAHKGGYESTEHYTNIRYQFFNVHNIHVMRESLQKLTEGMYVCMYVCMYNIIYYIYIYNYIYIYIITQLSIRHMVVLIVYYQHWRVHHG